MTKRRCLDCGWLGEGSHGDYAAQVAYILGVVVRYGDDNDDDYAAYRYADDHAHQVTP